ncbi:MAG: dehydrogenase, partial [Planctomycetales bacterium]|nr:dehydrogenase [Planctomycetales bacterium]
MRRTPNLLSFIGLISFGWLALCFDIAIAQEAQPAELAVQLQAGLFEPSLRVADDLRCDLILREPVVANPLHLSFDERGRLWVVQYRQYPWPAGLKLLSRDNVWRNVYSPAAPPPPPHAEGSPFRGHDRITIHEDTNGNGRFDREVVFLNGLNFATAALPGRGGVYVLNPPYLLFYADANRDDVPDSDQPELLLSGFGIEDSHSIANSLRWG